MSDPAWLNCARAMRITSKLRSIDCSPLLRPLLVQVMEKVGGGPNPGHLAKLMGQPVISSAGTARRLLKKAGNAKESAWEAAMIDQRRHPLISLSKRKTTMEHCATNASSAEQAASNAHHAIDRLSEAVSPGIRRAAASAHHMVDRLSDATEHGAERLGRTATRLIDAEQHLVAASSGYVRQHPVKSAGIALIAGFLLCQLSCMARSHQRDHKPNRQAEDGPDRSQE